MVLGGGFPGDVRVTKEARSLLAAGHRITLLSLGKNGMPESEEIEGISVIRIFPSANSIKRTVKAIWSSVFFDDQKWRKALEKIVMEQKITILHCHDLPTVNLTRKVARKHNIPVIADLHENFPEGIAVWRKGKISKKLWFYTRLTLPLPIWMYKRLEKSALQKVDRIITVIDEAKEHYINDCAIPPNRITVVMNTEDLIEFDKLKAEEAVDLEYENDFLITFIGTFGPHRGVETAIMSMSEIKKKIPHAKLILIGMGPGEYLTLLKKMCVTLQIEDNVIFTGWVDFAQIPSYIAGSDVCLVPHNVSGHTNTTIPHKLFQYMALKKPVIVTDCRPLKRIVEECGCGLVVASENSKEMAQAVISLYEDKKLSSEMGENGRRAVEEKYNWEIEGSKLVGLYDEIKQSILG
jgi:glycosyltransferase involved in cell wall biosynthesis